MFPRVHVSHEIFSEPCVLLKGMSQCFGEGSLCAQGLGSDRCVCGPWFGVALGHYLIFFGLVSFSIMWGEYGTYAEMSSRLKEVNYVKPLAYVCHM